MRARLQTILTDVRFERFVTGLILVNAVTLGLETSPTVMAVAGPIILTLDKIILGIFVVEIAARLYVHRLDFFRDPWSVFDFLVVAIALMPSSGALSVLRALRVLRVLRLITVMPSLRRVVGGLITALPGMGSVVMLLGLLYYVFAVIATKLFGKNFPEWFGTIGESLYSLFQIMTLESWSMGIVRPVMEVYPFAWAFFVPFILCTTFTMLNLFIGIVVSAMQSEHAAEDAADKRQLHEDAERGHEDAARIAEEVRALRAEIAALRAALPIKP